MAMNRGKSVDVMLSCMCACDLAETAGAKLTNPPPFLSFPVRPNSAQALV